jgi:predicted DNA-binding transcriptional regulator AlpA
MTERLLRAEDVCKAWDISRSGVYNLATSGILPCVRFRTKGKRDTIRFREEDLDAFVRGHLCDGRDRST